ncbi:MAG: hypothetical protein RL095_1140 [Verrucomicrobiota bacterium]|jgi:PAS domain S-box-containing protein
MNALRDEAFYRRTGCPPPSPLLLHQADSFYFAKDAEGRFVHVTRGLLDLLGKNAAEVLGRRDDELFSLKLATDFQRDDQQVMQSGEMLQDKLELVPAATELKWFITVKSPLRDPEGRIVGIESVTRDARQTHARLEPFHEFSRCMDFIRENLHRPLKLEELAAVCAMSVSNFERKFKKNFGASPGQYLKRLRLEKAGEWLLRGLSPAEAATRSGFCGQSHFTREFRQALGITPKKWQERHLGSRPAPAE